MRNLKKILALVLALVMSLSLMATAGAADNSAAANSETISAEYQTAKDVLSALGVFKGYEDGTFKPKQSITRAEVATILYRMVTGDVASARSDIYGDMQQSTFTDLAGANWARGYINYCANAKLIVGVGGNKFQPSANITGYATLAMVLRALGYDKNGEFQGTGWEIRTASTARELGILNNVNAAEDLGKPATREMVAEILFRAMLCDMVEYNALTQDYKSVGVTLGYKVFTLEKVEGVVVANEYADIRRDADGKSGGYNTISALAGSTVLRSADKDRIVKTASTLEDLGETRIAYTTENTNTVRDTYDDLRKIPLENPDKDTITYDGGEAKSSLSGLVMGNEAEHFINFGETTSNVTTTIKVTYQANKIETVATGLTSDAATRSFLNRFHLVSAANLVVAPTYAGSGVYDITYIPSADDEVMATTSFDAGHTYSVRNVDGTYFYTVEITPSSTFTPFDEDMVTAIFNYADRVANPAGVTLVVNGEVYRGTQSVHDFSDGVFNTGGSYEDFRAACLKESVENTSVTGNSNGWWLKIIDNDKDGVTDWVFQTRYTVATVSSIKDGVPTLETDGLWTNHNDSRNAMTNASATTDESGDLVAGDVVYYAVIDGVARAYKADVVEARVNTVNRNAKSITTVDGTTYDESEVHEHSGRTDIASRVVNMSGTTNYKMYLDKYGYLAAFSQNITGKFVLLTNGWARNVINGTEFAVTAWDSESKGYNVYNVTSGGSQFIRGANNNDVNSWNNIRWFPALNCNDITHTVPDDIHSIVAYMEVDGENATLRSVDTIYDIEDQNNRGYWMIDTGVNIPDSTITNGTVYQTTTSAGQPYDLPGTPNAARVRALSTTTYYYVYRNQATTVTVNEQLGVHQITGYEAGAKWLNATDRAFIEDVYVVGRQAQDVDTAGNTGVFYTADVVVVEMSDEFRPNHLALEQVFIYDFPTVSTSVMIEEVSAIRADGSKATLKIDLTTSRTYTEANATPGDVRPGRAFLPGLYYLHRTDRTTTDDIWAVEPMSHWDILNSSVYDVGTVSASKDILPDNYVITYNWFCGDSVDLLVAGDSHGTNDNRLLMRASAVENERRTGVEASKYYTLSYDGTGRIGTANETTAGNCLRQPFGGTPDDSNINQVLVRYNDKDEIVYAVSFAHTATAPSGATIENTAQSVWRRVALPPDLATLIDILTDELDAAAAAAIEEAPEMEEAINGALMEAKDALQAIADSVKNPVSYWDKDGAHQDAINAAAAGKAAIEEAAKGDVDPIEAAKAEAKAEAEAYKADEIAELTEEEDLAAVDAAKTAFDEAIEAAEDQDAIDAALAEYKAAIDIVLGIDPELEAAKEAAQDALDNYKIEEIEALEDEDDVAAVEAAKEALQAAVDAEDATAESIYAAIETYQKAIDKILDGPSGDVIVTFANAGVTTAYGQELLMPEEGSTREITDGVLVLEEGVDFEVISDPNTPNVVLHLQIVMGDDPTADDAVDCAEYLSEDGSKYEIPVTESTTITYNYYIEVTGEDNPGTDEPPIVVVPGDDEEAQTLALIPSADPTTKVTYYVIAAKGYTLTNNAPASLNCSELTLVDADKVPASIEAVRAETEKNNPKWTFVVYSFTFQLGDGSVWPTEKDFSQTKDTTLAEAVEKAIKDIEAAAEAAGKKPNMGLAERTKIKDIADPAIAKLKGMTEATSTAAEAAKLAASTIAAINAVEPVEVIGTHVTQLPTIYQASQSIVVNYHTEDGKEKLTDEEILELVNTNTDGVVATKVNSYVWTTFDKDTGTFIPSATGGGATKNTAIVTATVDDRTLDFTVTLNRMYAINIDGEFAGWVTGEGTTTTKVPSTTNGQYYLEEDVLAAGDADSAVLETNGGMIQRKNATGQALAITVKQVPDWASDPTGVSTTSEYSIGDQNFVTAYTVTGVDGMTVSAAKSGGKSADIALTTAAPSCLVQEGVDLYVQGAKNTSGAAEWIAYTVGAPAVQQIDSVEYVENNVVPSTFTVKDVEDDVTLGTVGDTKVVINGTVAGVYDSTTIGTSVATKETGPFVPYYAFDNIKSAWMATPGVTVVSGKLSGANSTVATTAAGTPGMATDKKVVDLVSAVSATITNAEYSAATLSYKDITGVDALTTFTTDTALLVAKDTTLDFTIAGTNDALQVTFTPTGGSDPVVEVIPAKDGKVSYTMSKTDGAYVFKAVTLIKNIVLGTGTASDKVADWNDLTKAVKSVNTAAGQTGIVKDGSALVTSISRKYFGDDGAEKTDTETDSSEFAAFIANIGAGNVVTVVLAVKADTAYAIAENVVVAPDTGVKEVVSTSLDKGVLTITVTYTATT